MTNKKAREHRGPSRLRTFLFSILTVTAGLLLIEAGSRVLLKDVLGLKAVPQPFFRFSVPEKKPGSFRIFFFGGSTVYGGHLPGIGFVSQFEILLKKCLPERPVEVFNFGASGRDSTYVRKAVEKTLKAGPDLIVVYTGHNEFIWPEADASLFSRLLGTLERSSTATLFRMPKEKLFPGLWATLPKRWHPVRRGSALFAEKKRIFEENLESIAATARRAGIPLVLCTAASNLSDWPPVRREVLDPPPEPGFVDLRNEAESALAAGDRERAGGALGRLASGFPAEPETEYLLGRVAEQAGDYPAARAHFAAAKEQDPIPFRALDDFNRKVREVAGQDGVFLADMERLFQENSPHGLVGFSLMTDNCHPLPQGNFLMATALLDLVNEKVLSGEGCREDGRLPRSVEEVMREAGFSGRDGEVLWRRNAEYCAQSPFLNRDAERRSLEQASLLAATPDGFPRGSLEEEGPD
jgi:lysophospholipase L1-like esterase